MPTNELRTPSSDGSQVRRVLIECDEPAVQDGLERVLRESGYLVSVCAGPAARSAGCPLVADGRCSLVEEAHVVVHALAPADAANREVLDALMRACPDVALVVEGDTVIGDARKVERVRFPMGRAALLDAIGRTSSP